MSSCHPRYKIIIIVTVTKKLFRPVYIKYYSKQGEKIMVLVRILMSKSGFKDEVLIKLIVGVVKHVKIASRVFLSPCFRYFKLGSASCLKYPKTRQENKPFSN
jgi:hypothetical protein